MCVLLCPRNRDRSNFSYCVYVFRLVLAYQILEIQLSLGLNVAYTLSQKKKKGIR